MLDSPAIRLPSDLAAQNADSNDCPPFSVHTGTFLSRTIDHKATGEAIRKARQESGISLRELARRLKLSPTHISDLENGRRTWNKRILYRISKALSR